MELITLVLLAAVCQTEERVVDPPDDSTRWHLSVVGSGPKFDQVVSWCSTYAQLADLKRQVHFHAVLDPSVEYRARYAATMTGKPKPIVRLQKGDGTLLIDLCGKDITTTAKGLYSKLYPVIRRHSPRRDEKRPDWKQALRLFPAPAVKPQGDCPDGRSCPAPKREPEKEAQPVLIEEPALLPSDGGVETVAVLVGLIGVGFFLIARPKKRRPKRRR